jgi:tRNA pseudouridine38-40 synthase
MKQRYKMVIAYDGTRFAGWQTQPDRPTIQGELERAVKELTGHKERIHSSGRTDAGVHARDQVAHFDLPEPIVIKKFLRGLNALLPEDIRVMSLRKAAPDFHARYDAKGKEYRYFIWNGRIMPPFVRQHRAHVRPPLNVQAMNRAAKLLVGKNDFAAFSANPNREIDGTVRHLRGLRVRKNGHELVIIARGDGFLYKMVRSLAGFLIRVGTGELEPDIAKVILHSKTRTARVPTAQPQGLFLWKVRY